MTRDEPPRATPYPRLSRRALVRGGVGLGGLGLLAACGGAPAGSATPTSTLPVTSRGSGSASRSVAAGTTTAVPTPSAASSAQAVSTVSQASRPAQAPTVLDYWGVTGPDKAGKVEEQLIAEFNASHPELRVTLENKPQTGVNPDGTPLTAAIAGGVAPDAVYVGISLVQGFGAKNGTASLDASSSRSAFPLDDFYRTFLDLATWRGKLFGIPYRPDVRGLFWNKDLFQAAGLSGQPAPATWNDLGAVGSKLIKRDGAGQLARLGFVPGWGNPPTYLAWFTNLWQLGGDILQPDHHAVAYNTGAGVQALQVMVDQMKQAGGYAAVQQFAKSVSVPTGLDLFAVGKLAMMYTTNSQMVAYNAVKSLTYDVAPFALPPSGQRVNYSGCPYLAITAPAKHPQQAWQLVEYLVSPQPLLRFNLAGNSVPSRKSVVNSAGFLKANPHFPFFANEMNYTRVGPFIIGYNEIANVFNTMYTAAMSGKSSAADAVAASVPQVQAILAKYAADL